ncbi:MAG: alpha-L-rhamnosidase N-terminal domain-containing protein, partial [Anaerolineae bacterium]|nr:alpha-L-rhamnosidase N-terminal domain-containing protein [Anaerolineae bacterium]
MKVVDLRYEHLTNPIGVDETAPRLSWKLSSETPNTLQAAYRIQAAESPTALQAGSCLWDSGKVESDASILVPYQGPALQSRQHVYWRVKAWDNHSQASAWSDPAWFEMALLKESDLQAAWIEPEEDFDVSEQQPASYTRKEFTLSAPIRKARLYITSLGFYQAYLNGKRVGDYCFAPTRTNYKHILHYQTYDVKELLTEGENTIGVLLGDGWLRNIGGFTAVRNIHGERLALLAQLEVELENGEKHVICSDGSWTATQNGPMRTNDAKEGEDYDARLEMPGWDQPHFDASAWHAVRVTKGNGAKVCASNSVPMTEHERFTPEVLTTPDGSIVLDFGQNIAGYISFKV